MKILVLSLALLGSLAWAQPIDPLLRPTQEPGQLRYSFGLSYAPDSLEALGFDPTLGPFRLLRVDQRLSLMGSLSYNLDERVRASLSLTPRLVLRQSERRFADQTERRDEADLSATASLGLGYRLAPESLFDPRLSLGLQYPWAIQTTASASLLRDPVVLGLSMSLTDPLDSRAAGLGLGLSTGFVANHQVSFSLGTSLVFALGGLEAPGASISLLTSYALEPEAEQEVAVRTTLSLRGAEARLSFGLELGGLVR
jgi:hypothetical protein